MCFCRLKTFLEITGVFAVFFLYGAWMTPDLNETHYVSKSINFWNPDWIQGDSFLESRDAHWAFYFVFGWLSFFCSPTVMAWIGRIAAWGLLAWSWQRLSHTLIPVRWIAIPTALALAYYIESFNMAGEWLIGGIEGKSLAYPFVFFALEAMLRRRWNHTGIFLGVACAFHILVGGWVTLIVGVIFFASKKIAGRRQTADGSRESATTSPKKVGNRPPGDCVGDSRPESAEYRTLPPSGRQPTSAAVCRLPWIGFIIGGLIALCGLLPALMLDAGTSSEITHKAHQIYAFDRLAHHLVPYKFKDSFLLRFALLTIIWVLLCRYTGGRKHQMFNGFVWGTLALAAIGIILAHCFSGNRELSAEILRFYWFRLSDIAVPIGIALGGMRCCLQHLKNIRQISLPSFPTVLGVTVVIVILYFEVTYLCFGYWKFTPDPSIAWAITLFALLVLFYRYTVIVLTIYFAVISPCFGYYLYYLPNPSVVGAIILLVCLAYFAFTLRPLRLNFTTKNTKDTQRTHRGVALALIYVALVFYAPLTVLPNYADLRTHSGQCRSEPVGPSGRKATDEWQATCMWIKENTPKTAKFWIPRDGQTFKWHAQRADIGTWKNIPQDAASIVTWWRSMDDLYRYKNAEGTPMTDRLITTLLNNKTNGQIAELQQRYGFDHIVCAQSYEMPKHSTLELVYENDVYVIYRVKDMDDHQNNGAVPLVPGGSR